MKLAKFFSLTFFPQVFSGNAGSMLFGKRKGEENGCLEHQKIIYCQLNFSLNAQKKNTDVFDGHPIKSW